MSKKYFLCELCGHFFAISAVLELYQQSTRRKAAESAEKTPFG